MVVYAVANGFKTGVFKKWDEAKKNIDDFPQPVYKKFETEEEANEFLEQRTPRTVQENFPEEDDFKTFYTVARGYDIGIFGDYKSVEKSIKDYPQPLHKKFTKLDEAIAYYNRFQKGIGAETTSPKTVKKNAVKEEKAKAYYAVARGHKTGVYLTWEECKQQTTDFKGAKFKKFDNEGDAQLFAEGKTLKQIEEAKAPKRKSTGDDGQDEEPEVKKSA
ncbi:unnamed protein product [Auanema sp. JU1783]|nr:unnamed protein product [Auanema sp. JU1783]